MATIIVEKVSVRKWTADDLSAECTILVDDFELQCKGSLTAMRIIRCYMYFRRHHQFKFQLLASYMARTNVQARAISSDVNGIWKAWLFNRCFRQERKKWQKMIEGST